MNVAQSATEDDSRTITDVAPSKVLLTAGEAAFILGISERHLHKLDATGQLPTPVKLGRTTRWRREELLEWVRAGCPNRDQWEARL